LRVYPGALDPDEVTKRLGISPSEVQREGDPRGSTTTKLNGWFLSSRGQVDSRDARRHIDWVLDHIEPVAADLEKLRGSGARVDLSCYWLSSSGHGGPAVSPTQSRRLAALNLDCRFDVYFTDRLLPNKALQLSWHSAF
jgi:hypothetical protein